MLIIIEKNRRSRCALAGPRAITVLCNIDTLHHTIIVPEKPNRITLINSHHYNTLVVALLPPSSDRMGTDSERQSRYDIIDVIIILYAKI